MAENINIYNGYTFKPRALTTCLIFTDASDEGYGNFILKYLKKKICSAKFKDCEKQTSSLHRELLAVKYVLDSFGGMLRNQSVQVSIDSFSASRILSAILLCATLHLQIIAFVQSQNSPVDLQRTNGTSGLL